MCSSDLKDNSRLVLILCQAHDGESFTDCDKRAEVDEAGNETGDQGRDERFAATPTDDQIRLF